MLTTPKLLNDDNWFPDSGATNHGRNKIHMGNGASLMIAHSSFSLLCSSDLPRVFSLSNLLHVPHITCNLISVSQFARENNVFFEFHPSICIVKDLAMGTPLLKRRLHEGLYRFNLFKAQPFSSTSSHQFSPISSKDYQVLSLKSSRIGGCGLDSPLLSTSNQNDDNVELFTILILWHRKLGHPTLSTVKQVLLNCNLKFSMNENDHFCSTYQLGKSHKLSFLNSLTIYNSPLHLIESDLWGAASVTSRNRFRYYISFVHVYSKYTWIYFLKSKYEVTQTFLHFKVQVELLLNRKIKILQIDWSGEFRSLNSFLQSTGVTHRLSCPHTSE